MSKSRHLRLVRFPDIQLGNGPRWLIKNLIPLYGLVLVWGSPKTGKSFWLFDALMHVVLGRSYRGLRVTQGPVVYVVAEGAEGFKSRVEAFRQHKMDAAEDGCDFLILPARLDAIADQERLINLIKQELGTRKPIAVAFDTVARTLNGPENSNDAMGEYVDAMDAVRDAFQCAVIMVHHSGVDGNRPRGASCLTGAVDAQLAVRRHGNGVISVLVDEMKDGPDGAVFHSRLEKVVVGTDEDGEDITSCIVSDLDGESISYTQEPRVSPQAARAYDILRELIDEEGVPPPEGGDLPESVSGVSRKLWRDRCKMAELAGSKDVEAFKKAFLRSRKALLEASLIGIKDENFVYLMGGQEPFSPM